MSNGSLSPAGEKHPGVIHNLDKTTGRAWDEAAADVPQHAAWVLVEGAWKAVVRTEATGNDARLEITKFGVDGQLLETTMLLAPPPPMPSDPAPVPVPVPTPERRD